MICSLRCSCNVNDFREIAQAEITGNCFLDFKTSIHVLRWGLKSKINLIDLNVNICINLRKVLRPKTVLLHARPIL